MPITNLSSVTFTPAEVKKVQDAIADIKSVIVSKATNLNEKERQLYGSINEANKLVVQKIFQYVASNPEIVPSLVDKAEFQRDYQSRNTLESWISELTVTLSNLSNTKILLDYDVFQTVLTIYRNTRYLANENVAGMNTIYTDLKQFFPGGGSKPE